MHRILFGVKYLKPMNHKSGKQVRYTIRRCFPSVLSGVPDVKSSVDTEIYINRQAKAASARASLTKILQEKYKMDCCGFCLSAYT